MSEIAKIIGQRLRCYRIQLGLSQEKVAERSGCHPTYIGQVERGEKNATLESIEKIASSLSVPLATLFEDLGDGDYLESTPHKCYEFVASKSQCEQDQLYNLLLQIDSYKKANG